jgi:hypothetical protein
MAEQINILCMKWGTKYGPEYVNKLYGMVSRNLHRPFRFVCLTDNSAGVHPQVDCLPLPELALPEGAPERGWNKLTTFINPLFDIQGRVLFLDLDVVIVGALDDFFDVGRKLHIIKDFVRKDGTGNSSVYLFEAGAFPDVIANFRQNFVTIQKQHRNEQEYLSHYLLAQNKLAYWPGEWCRSFKYDCLPGVLGSWFFGSRVPEGARVIIFHGSPNPDDAIEGRSGKWYRHVRPAKWINQYWRE